jgi:hypothetical protein
MTMKITGSGTPFEVDDKRFYLPGVKVEGECPACKKPFKRDLSTDPALGYPTANTPTKLNCWCPECEHEWSIPIKLSITVELVDPEPSGA